ncbi:hypothetical protein [Aeromicrobium choanae]|uniref:Transcriptional regulator, AbiEi antitoxin, Type IV TA system n=1 Tax=Aeromicrobium choanae TaxID=1736691 RepID=A0A1T4Z1C6_9ACTN|nr:hypothetical protein [Aeromicrobium choanae]SKB07693.1 hypothetical protein SAMN06295964_1786 [Aeromicrobium choanae]
MRRHHDQDGVVARRQLLADGLTPNDVRRLLRRRELTVVHDGVYVDHTGPLTWRQRAWAAVLWAWPAALWGESALVAGVDEDRAGPVHVGVAHARRLSPPDGVIVTRARDFASRVQWNLAPPRVTYEDAVLDVAATARRFVDQMAVLADAVGSRRTTSDRLRARLDSRPRFPRRALFERLLADIATGTHSVLEHGYLTRVERAHGLPPARRQVRQASGGSVRYRDAEVGRVVIELDGRLHHSSVGGRDRDLERDLDTAVADAATVRLGWGQVFERPCATATKLVMLFVRDGWEGTPVPCGAECSAGWGSGSPDVIG